MLTATLPPTRTYDARQLALLPGNILVVQQGKRATRYEVTCVEAGEGIKRFELKKDNGVTYTTQYVVGTSVSTCTCPAGHYRRFNCVHLDACREIADDLTPPELEFDPSETIEEMDNHYANQFQGV